MKLIFTKMPNFNWPTMISAIVGLVIIGLIDWRIAFGVFLTHLKFNK